MLIKFSQIEVYFHKSANEKNLISYRT